MKSRLDLCQRVITDRSKGKTRLYTNLGKLQEDDNSGKPTGLCRGFSISLICSSLLFLNK